jgi:26S proteasome regulatory subunit (ATPase 3-interacting protein)
LVHWFLVIIGKEGIKKGSVAQNLVLNYLKKQNRPYNLIALFENLHRQIPKTELQKCLDKLVKEAVVCEQIFGKAKIYTISQSQYPEVSGDQLQSLEDELKQLETEHRLQLKLVGGLREDVLELEKAQTTNELAKKVAILESELGKKLISLICIYQSKTTQTTLNNISDFA